MPIRIILTVLVAAALSHAADADFVITGMAAAADPPLIPQVPKETPASANNATSRQFKPAYGFGNQVPLSFAVRQIVPPITKVIYGPGADPDALVDWKGGQTWNRVLLAAVKPLGLRLIFTDQAVEIRN